MSVQQPLTTSSDRRINDLLPVELIMYILQVVILPACDLRFKIHEVVLPPIDCQHHRRIEEFDRTRERYTLVKLVCRRWHEIVQSKKLLYRDLIITSYKENFFFNTYFDEELDYGLYLQHIHSVRQIDIAYPSDHRPPAQRSSTRRRSRRSRNGFRDVDRQLRETNPETQIMLLLNRFSTSPLQIDDHPYLISSQSPPVPAASPSNPLGTLIFHLNVNANAALLPVVLHVVSGCERLERLGLFNVTIPPLSVSTSYYSLTYKTMDKLKSLQLKLDWSDSEEGVPWMQHMRANGLALPSLSRLRIHCSDPAMPVPINLIYLISSHSPLEQIDIEGTVGSGLPTSLTGTQWGVSIRQLEMSVAEHDYLRLLPNFFFLPALEVLVLNELAGIIATTGESDPQIPAKEAWLNTIFVEAERFCRQKSINEIVIGELGDSDTFGPTWRVIARSVRDLELRVPGTRVWVRKNRSYTPIRLHDYLENERRKALADFRQNYMVTNHSPTASTS